MSWNGVKKQSLKSDIEAWCEEMEIENYTINSKGEIDVNGDVWLYKFMKKNDFKELPYKFGKVDGIFRLFGCKNLISLKNCPNIVRGYFSCNGCRQLDSLEGCPKEVNNGFFCTNCKREFTKEEVKSLCKVE